MKRILIVVALVMFSLPAWAQFVAPGGAIPVVANNAGLNGTFWRSDVSILNTADINTSILLILFPEIVNGAAAFEPIYSDPISIQANGQKTLSNIVQSQFGLFDQKGALYVLSSDLVPLVISSRVYTQGDSDCEGSYGQDVNSILAAEEAWVSGIEHSSSYRSNLGIFLPTAPAFGGRARFTIEIFDNDGVLAGYGTLDFYEPGMQQVSLDSFGVGLLLDGYAVITCSDTTMLWSAYGSVVDETSGDAVFRPARGYQPVK